MIHHCFHSRFLQDEARIVFPPIRVSERNHAAGQACCSIEEWSGSHTSARRLATLPASNDGGVSPCRSLIPTLAPALEKRWNSDSSEYIPPSASGLAA